MLGEIEIIKGIQDLFQGSTGTSFLIFCSRWLIFFLTIPVALTGLRKRHRGLRHAAYRAAWAALVALVISLLLGMVFARVRPFRASDQINLLVSPPASTYSFPSSHASVAFAVAAALLYGDVSIGLLALLMAVFVAFGRVATGVHYPSDVFAGMLLGFAAYALTRAGHAWLHRKYFSRRKIKSSVSLPPPVDVPPV